MCTDSNMCHIQMDSDFLHKSSCLELLAFKLEIGHLVYLRQLITITIRYK